MANSDNTRNVLTANMNYNGLNEIGDGYYANSFYGTYDHFQRIGWFFDKIVSNLTDLENCQEVLTGRFVYVIDEDAIFMRDHNFDETPYKYYPFGNYQYVPSSASFEVISKVGYGKFYDNAYDNADPNWKKPNYYIEKYSVYDAGVPFEKLFYDDPSRIPEGIFPDNYTFFEDMENDWKWSSTVTRNGVSGYPCKIKTFYENGQPSYVQKVIYNIGDDNTVPWQERTIVEIKVVQYNDLSNAEQLTGFRFIGFATRKSKLLVGEDGEYINLDFQKEIPYKIARTKNIQQMSAYYFPTNKNEHIFKLKDYKLFTSKKIKDSDEVMNTFDKDRYEEGSYKVYE